MILVLYIYIYKHTHTYIDIQRPEICIRLQSNPFLRWKSKIVVKRFDDRRGNIRLEKDTVLVSFLVKEYREDFTCYLKRVLSLDLWYLTSINIDSN